MDELLQERECDGDAASLLEESEELEAHASPHAPHYNAQCHL